MDDGSASRLGRMRRENELLGGMGGSGFLADETRCNTIAHKLMQLRSMKHIIFARR